MSPNPSSPGESNRPGGDRGGFASSTTTPRSRPPSRQRVAPQTPKKRGRVSRTLGKLAAIGLSVAIAVAAFLSGLWIFNSVVMPRWVHQGEEVRVPEIVQLEVRQAERVLDQSGLRLSIRGEQFDPNVPKGFVIWQDPVSNEIVRRGRSVQALVSLGEEFASVPELQGESERSARILLTRSGLQIGDVVEAHSGAIPAGLILATDPAPQAVLARGQSVHLVVSRGPVPGHYLMPDLRGKDVGAIRQSFEALGFPVEIAGSVGSFATIVEHSPSPGARLASGQQIVLRVAGRVVP